MGLTFLGFVQDHPAVAVIMDMHPTLLSAMPSTFDIAQQFNQYANAVEKHRNSPTDEPAKLAEQFGVFASTGLTGNHIGWCIPGWCIALD